MTAKRAATTRRVRQGTAELLPRLSPPTHASRATLARPMSPASMSPSSPSPRTLTIATRRSPLALAQCRAFVQRLGALDPSVQLQELQVVTSGDRIQDRPLAEIGGKGLFVKEIEEALLDRRADLAVHSIKDVPGLLPAGLRIACIPPARIPATSWSLRLTAPSARSRRARESALRA